MFLVCAKDERLCLLGRASLFLKCVSQCAVSVATFTLSPIKDGLHTHGDGCEGRLVQALLSNASRVECCSMFLQCMFLLCRKRTVHSHW